MKRVFVVGCPRSGTTLIQSIISGQSGLRSFPESSVFTNSVIAMRWKIYGRLFGFHTMPIYYGGRLLNYFGITWPRLKKRVLRFLDDINLSDERKHFESLPNNADKILPAFVGILDKHAGDKGWVEKTPSNLFCIDVINKYVPDALFIHVIRDGESTIASIVDAARKHEDWDRSLKDDRKLERLVQLWNKSTEVSLSYEGKPNHLVIKHEDLTKNSQTEVQKITSFLGIPYNDDLMEFDASPYILPHETWKKEMGKTIKPQKSKFSKVFTPEEQSFIKKRLKYQDK